MTRIFISYRRSDDAGSVGRVRDRLRDAYGEDAVFRDIDGIPKGTRFSDVIQEELATCDVLLVVMGPRWLDAKDDAGGRRLDHPDDWVRTEVELGLARKDLRVLPVLVGGAILPKPAELPESMRPLLQWNAAWLEDDSFDHDFGVLVRDIGGRRGLRRYAPALAGGAVAVALLAGFVVLRGGGDGGGAGPTQVGARSEEATGTTEPPERMRGGFNVAVAEFRSTDPTTQAQAEVLAARLTRTLQAELSADPNLPDVEVRGPDEVGTLSGDTPEERSQAADEIARAINADVVIDGSIDFSDPSSIQPEALLNPAALADSPELGGYYPLGYISYPGSYTNQLTEDGLVAALTNATSGLAHFVRGVSYYQLLDGVPDPADPTRTKPGSAGENRAAAAAAFRAALASPGLPNAAKAAAHGFLGSLALLSHDDGEAARQFTAALELNPESTRAQLGMAEVRFQLANGLGCEAGTVDAAGLAKAAADFAAVEPAATDPSGTAIKGTLGEARVRRCLSQAGSGDDFAAVDGMLREVIANASDDPAQQELAAVAHAELALVLAPPAAAPADPVALEAALAETQQAIEITKREPNEAIFQWQAAFYLQQLGRADEATAALAEAARLDPAFRPVTLQELEPQGSGRLVPQGDLRFSVAGALAFTGREVRGLVALALVLLALGLLALAASVARLGRPLQPPHPNLGVNHDRNA